MQNFAKIRFKHVISKALHSYADFRIGASEQEKRCFKPSDSVLLTFDDFGSKNQIESILSILDTKNVKAMFFLIGSWVNDNPDLLNAIVSRGHIVGNHTLNHADLLNLDEEKVEAEVIGGYKSRWLRPPQGRYNSKIREIATRMGYSICYWTIDSQDWKGVSVEEMKHTILSELHPGAVVLLHINGEHTVELLPGIIDAIRAKGCQLTAPDETW